LIISSSYEELKDLVNAYKFPMVLCDIDALDHNLEKVGKILREINKKLRLCTKSVRVPELIKKVEEKDFVNGLFTYNSAEALFYAEKYRIKDILLGYPTISSIDAEELCKAASIEGVSITAMVDSISHLDLLEEVASKHDVILKILIEVDVADKFLGINVGVYRSPLRKPEDVVNIAKEIDKRQHLQYRGIMGYEAQNASIGDASAFMRWIKNRSRKHVNQWRQEIIDALKREGYESEVVNGGGSGCFQETAAENSITEIGIGSLLFKSHIFDTINSLDDFLPSLFFALQIVRKPKKDIVTAFSGGYVSSGAVKAMPLPVKPEKLKTIKNEEFGEVQTPFKYNPKKLDLNLGDPIFCRFGKAGEPLEHFNKIHSYSNGKITGHYLTYRGMGKRFS
jgi:D-serine deaminase-like pyridoxal phosphate-dependent protein